MTYTATAILAKTGLTNQSRLPVKKALAAAPALKLVSAIAPQSLLRLKQPHALSVQCPAPAALTSTQRKVSPTTVVVPSSRQIESIAKHLKRSQSVSKAHPVVVQRRLKPSHPSSLHFHALSPIPSEHSESAREAEKSTESQVLEALRSLRVSSPVSTVSSCPGSRIPRRAADCTQNPTSRLGLKSCLVKKNVVLSNPQLPQPRLPQPRCRPAKRVQFVGTSTCTFPNVLWLTTDAEPSCKGENRRLTHGLTSGADFHTGWVRWNEPAEKSKLPGTRVKDNWIGGEPVYKTVKQYHVCACQLESYCKGYCRDLAARGGFKMPALYPKHPDSDYEATMPLLRCSHCIFRMSEKDRWMEESGCHIVMAGSMDVYKVPATVSTRTILARPRTCECKYDSLSLPANPVDGPYNFDNDPDIF